MYELIPAKAAKSKSSVASIALTSSRQPDGRLGNKFEKPRFDAFLCPSSGSTIMGGTGLALVRQFDLSEKNAPSGIYTERTTHPAYNLRSSERICFALFRNESGKAENGADIINLCLVDRKRDWADSVLKKIAKEIGKILKSSGFRSIGGFDRVQSEIKDDIHGELTRKLFGIFKEEFGKMFAVSGNALFPIEGESNCLK